MPSLTRDHFHTIRSSSQFSPSQCSVLLHYTGVSNVKFLTSAGTPRLSQRYKERICQRDAKGREQSSLYHGGACSPSVCAAPSTRMRA